jgi:tetratricopeptide (TPR) repeat protein
VQLAGRARRGAAITLVVAAAAVAVTAVASSAGHHRTPRTPPPAPVVSGALAAQTTATDALTRNIAMTQADLRAAPDDYRGWATLGLDYVQQAKITINPAYYPKAKGALARSLHLHHAGNYVAMAGEAALNAAEHRFRAARRWAQRGLTIDPESSTLYGALDDADTQLGHYTQAFTAVRRMNRLQPGVPAFTRAEYAYELRGDLRSATRVLEAARQAATEPSDVAFVDYYLAELALNQGKPRKALRHDVAGLRVDSSYFALLEGKAKAEAALGRSRAAVRDFRTVVSDVPQPEYVVEAGEYLQSLGRMRQARAQYRLFATENRLFASNGVTLDTDPTLFYADHGRPRLALRYGRVGIRIRPFVEMDDAYAWALHANGRDRAAISYERKAMQLGTRSALFAFHAGMIERALGDTAAARRDLTRALSINPHFNPLLAPIARQTLAALGGAT